MIPLSLLPFKVRKLFPQQRDMMMMRDDGLMICSLA